MTHCLKTAEFDLEYVESKIDYPSLWESHCHAQFEMIAVAEGDVCVMLEGKSYRLKENQAVIIPPLSYHALTANGKGTYRRVTALFDLSAIPEVLRSEFAKRGTDITIALSPSVITLAEICQKEEPDFYTPLAHSLMVQIFYDALKENQIHMRIASDEFLQTVIPYIDQHLHEKILLDDLARHTARSKSSFCHMFEEKMNISPKQYMLQKRMALANKMINDGIPPTVAAMQVGYENYSSFYRLYCKNLGKCPTRH